MIKVENLLVAFHGIVTVTIFVLLVLLGGDTEPSQTFFFREISYLISPYSSLRGIAIPIYLLFHFNLFLYSVVLSFRFQNSYARIGAIYLALSAIIGLFLLAFPMDKPGSALTATGVSHVMIVVSMSFFVVVSMLLFSLAFQRMKHLHWLSHYSYTIAAMILFTVVVTALFALMNKSLVVAFLQKLPITAFMVWIMLTVIGVLRSDRRIKHYFYHSRQ